MLKIFYFKSEVERSKRFCEENGLNWDYVVKLSSDSESTEKALWSVISPNKFFPEDIVPDEGSVSSVLKNSNLRIPEYQKNLCLNGKFSVFSPFSGNVLKSFLNVPCDAYHVAYIFKDVHEFFLLVGRWHGRRAAIFIPDLAAVFVLDAPEQQPEMVDMMWNSVLRVKSSNIYKKYSREVEFIEESCGNSTDVEVRTLLIGLKENLGHYFWQEMAGVERINNMSGATIEFDVVTCSNRWLSVKELFPDLKIRKYIELESPKDLFNYDSELYDEKRAWIRPVGLHISQYLKDRIYSLCKQKVESKVESAGTNKYSSIISACSNHTVLWVNLRSHNKTWISQASGLIELAIDMSERISNFAIFVDGFGDVKCVADEIRLTLQKHSIPVFDGINIPFEESLVWAAHVGSYVSVIGSGLVLNSWLVSKSGVAHSNIAHLNQKKFWNDVSDGADSVHFINESSITGDAAMYGEYDFDWRILVEPLVKILLDK
ncbi:hypothetical protein ACFOEW_11950 [Alteromonas oceani]|uniref:Uncharacterized protein n=1 Tax=Alteromonas oceani TaxID=2071609 RepID=A0ABV7K0Q7_9ALTE|nr:hypothetical protein [Alteromonas oceani]